MAHKKVSHHHGKAGEAIARGDLKAAAHHLGHALSACRNPDAHDDETGMDDDEGLVSGSMIPEGGSEARVTKPSSLRDRLKGFKKVAD